MYVSRDLPAFYVNVVFIDTPESTVYVGGEEKHNFVRIVIEQIARTLPDPGTEAGKKYRRMWMDMINDVSSASKDGVVLDQVEETPSCEQ